MVAPEFSGKPSKVWVQPFDSSSTALSTRWPSMVSQTVAFSGALSAVWPGSQCLVTVRLSVYSCSLPSTTLPFEPMPPPRVDELFRMVTVARPEESSMASSLGVALSS